MGLFNKKNLIIQGVFAVCFLCAAAVGITLGIALAETRNIQNLENIGEYQPSLPSQILDANDRLITEFFSDEKREIVSIDELPKHLLYALVTREDREFFQHKGFSFRGTFRAAWNILTGSYVSGGSTITQQLAGNIRPEVDRNEISVKRKIIELWWAFQLERSHTKYEILEEYLNRMYFGSGVYGVEAACRFYYGHSAREITLAESAALVIQLANSFRYNPLKNPNSLKKIQQKLLEQMVELGYVTQEEADISYEEYWNNFDYTRSGTSSAFFEREDRAPYFSEYVRQQLDELLYGSRNIYKDGYIVHTTLNLDFQAKADELMQQGLLEVNAAYHSNSDKRMSYAEQEFVPIIDLLSVTFNIGDLRVAGSKEKQKSQKIYQKNLNPIVDITSMLFGIDEMKFNALMGYALEKKTSQRTTVEGALVAIENSSGRIISMVGGSRFESINQFNRAVQAEVQPGSSFKPLYYAAAVEARKITPATMIYDSPVVFWNDDGTAYSPNNYKGEWKGPVLVREALARSMNVPSLRVLEMIGFDGAINTASKLLGITSPDQVARIFPRKYPMGLGIISVAPIQMARAFATFPNQGREVIPIGVRYIEDRTGKIILEPEKELRDEQRRRGQAAQIISPQTAFIMTNMLQSTVEWGTLGHIKRVVGGFTMPMGGKTGTTQNWSDIWTVGFSPYYTTAVWFGFDQPGNSLGVSQTGALAAGPVWGKYMKFIHTNLEPKTFPRPEGIVETSVTARSGLLPPPGYEGKITKEVFIAGTEPKRLDDFIEFEKTRDAITLQRIMDSLQLQELPLQDSMSASAGGLRLDSSIMSGGDSPSGSRFLDRGIYDESSSNPLLD
ncbi:MAG: PBP1A family penicillin-binding protein [Spirochaetales bacterium]|jgi:penicillin-binding protein 1A|nr:PBP1A family penicillin-binding protein [Spirochaetales bacterium]